jgi:UDP-N-acetylmuramyl pentapeptide phosphotransferase/UDP-N-acetylglucosamine-1-phosphate transferase
LDISSKPQKLHNQPIPRAGGLPIFLTFALLGFKFPLGVKLIVSSFPVFIGGFLEDITQKISYKYRFLFISIGGLLFLLLFKNSVVTNLGVVKIPYTLGVLFTIFALVGITNAFNIIDGINGLSSGIALTVFTTLWILSFQNSLSEFIPVLEILIGAVLVFFVLNFFFNKIFLGDGGSYFLGFTAGVLSILLVKALKASPWVPIVLMFYPIWETIFSIVRRLRKEKSPFYPDKEHLHHLFFTLFGKNHFKTTIIILTFQVISSLLVIAFYQSNIVMFLTVLIQIVVYTFAYSYLKKKLGQI